MFRDIEMELGTAKVTLIKAKKELEKAIEYFEEQQIKFFQNDEDYADNLDKLLYTIDNIGDLLS